MSPLKIKIATESIPTEAELKKRGGKIFMQCYVEVNGEPFPEKGWSDLASGVITWWMAAFIEMVKDDKPSARNPFMDGPYSFICTKKDHQLVLTFHTHDNEDYSLLPPTALTIEEYKHELLHAANTVIRLTESFGVPEDDHSLKSVKTMKERLLAI